MTSCQADQPESDLDLYETSDSQYKPDDRSILIDHLVTQFTQVRQERTKRTIAQLIELAQTFDSTIPHMQLLFQDTVLGLLTSGEELDTDLKVHLEEMFGIPKDVEDPQIIEGESIPRADE